MPAGRRRGLGDNAIRFRHGHGTCPLAGEPNTIALELAHIPQAGCVATTLAFVIYVREFQLSCDELIPRLEQMGLRAPNRPG